MTANDIQVCAGDYWILPVFSATRPSSCLCYSYVDSPPLPDDATNRISYRRGRPGTIRVSGYGNSVSPEKTGHLLRLLHLLLHFHYSVFTTDFVLYLQVPCRLLIMMLPRPMTCGALSLLHRRLRAGQVIVASGAFLGSFWKAVSVKDRGRSKQTVFMDLHNCT